MSINRNFFFEHLEEKLYPKGLVPSQKQGHVAVLDAWEGAMAASDDRWLAYHETGQTLQPVRETFAKTDAEAAARLENAWEKGKLPWVKEPYWRKDANGKYWFGRGLVQLTHKDNYQTLGGLIGENLVADPDRALDMDVAIKVMFTGMTRGSFTGHKLADFFHGHTEQWKSAREIINGTESAALVAGYAQSYYASISYTT